MRYGFWDTEWGRHNFLSFWAIFCPVTFHPRKNLENQNFEKMKKVIILYMCTRNHDHMMYGSRDMGARDIIFCHFGSFLALSPHYWPRKLKFQKNVKNIWRYYPFTHMYNKWRFLRYKVRPTEFLPFWAIFCPFTPLKTRKIKIIKNMKNPPGYIIILHLSTTNDNHMMHTSWDMKRDRQFFFSFWTVFCPFLPFDTWDLYYFESSLSLQLLIEVFF